MLRLDKFKKVAEDDNVVTMRHDDGHEMKIFLNGLKSKLQREQLKRLKLAEGGSVESGKQRFDHEKGVHRPVEETDNPKYGSWQRRSKAGKHINEMTHPDHAPDSREKRDNNNLQNKAKDEHYKVLGEIVSNKNKDRKYLADGGDPGPDGDYMTNSTPFYDGSKEKWTQYPQEQNRAPASDSKPDDSQDQDTPDSGHTTNVIINPTPAPTQTSSEGSSTVPQIQQQNQPQQSPAAQYGQKPVSVQQPSVNYSTVPNTDPNGTMNPGAVALNSQRGAAIQRDVNVSKGQAEAQVQQGYNQAVTEQAQKDQDNFNKFILGPTEQFKQYMNQNPINPKAYQENMSTGQKVSTAIGLFLGGFKQGLVGGNNPAMDFLNHQIDRDINGQKARADQQRTIWGAYRDLYGDSNVTSGLAKASMIDLYNNKMRQVALQLNTPQAWANYQQAASQLAIERSKALQESAVNLRMLPGFRSSISGGAGSGGGTTLAQSRRSGGSSGSFGNDANASDSSQNGSPSRILNSRAQSIYSQLKYDPTKTPEQKSEIMGQYEAAVQTDKALNQIDQLYPQLIDKATWGGYLANKVNPHAVGAAFAAGAEGIGAMTAPVTGGASLIGAIPAAIAAGGAGEVVGHGLKQAGAAVGGQQQIQYETAKASLEGYIGSALAGVKVTPTEISELAERFAPTKIDSAETAKDKLNKLKEKIIALTHTSALDQAGMSNKR